LKKREDGSNKYFDFTYIATSRFTNSNWRNSPTRGDDNHETTGWTKK